MFKVIHLFIKVVEMEPSKLCCCIKLEISLFGMFSAQRNIAYNYQKCLRAILAHLTTTDYSVDVLLLIFWQTIIKKCIVFKHNTTTQYCISNTEYEYF